MAVADPKNPDTAVRVQPGDTLSAIAKANGLTLNQLKALNPKIAGPSSDPKYQNGNMIWSNTKVNIAPTAPKNAPTPNTPYDPTTGNMPDANVPTPTPTPSPDPTPDPTPQPRTPIEVLPTDPAGGLTPKSSGGVGATLPGQVGGGGVTGGLPGGATAYSGGFSQSDIDKAFKSGQDATATTVAADKYANKVKASDKLISLFAANGITDPGFATFISDSILNDVSEAETLIKIYEQPAYKLRFPGMATLRTKNRTITEAQYMGLENQIVETLRFFDLPIGFYDNRATLGTMIANEVSPKEVQDRAQMAQDIARAADPAIRDALMKFYSVNEGAVTAYFLNADAALPLLQKSAKAAEIAGIGFSSGFEEFSKAEAEKLGVLDSYSQLSQTKLTQGFGQASTLAQTQARLAQIEQSAYSDREALQATLEGDQQAMLASQKRAQRETGRFSQSGGLSSYSLRSGSESAI